MTNGYRVGDKVRTIVGTVADVPSCFRVVVAYDDGTQATYHTDYVELVERPFTPPAAGKLFRNEAIWVSLGPREFRLVRFADGEVPKPGSGHDLPRPWAAMVPNWLADIEVLDV